MSKANADAATDKTIAPTIAETIERRARKSILILISVPNGSARAKIE
jgi:hypothetical protein